MKKKIVKTTDWLTRRYTEEELDKMKEEAIKEAEVELQKKQIEEMAMLISGNEIQHCGHRDIAERLYNAGYSKQEWISVEDRLPDVLDDYLVVVKLKYEWETECQCHNE